MIHGLEPIEPQRRSFSNNTTRGGHANVSLTRRHQSAGRALPMALAGVLLGTRTRLASRQDNAHARPSAVSAGHFRWWLKAVNDGNPLVDTREKFRADLSGSGSCPVSVFFL